MDRCFLYQMYEALVKLFFLLSKTFSQQDFHHPYSKHNFLVCNDETMQRCCSVLHFCLALPFICQCCCCMLSCLLHRTVDKEEVEQQMLLGATARAIVEKVAQFAEKMRQDEARKRGQLQQAQDAAFQQAEEASPLKYLQVSAPCVLRLRSDFSLFSLFKRFLLLEMVLLDHQSCSCPSPKADNVGFCGDSIMPIKRVLGR